MRHAPLKDPNWTGNAPSKSVGWSQAWFGNQMNEKMDDRLPDRKPDRYPIFANRSKVIGKIAPEWLDEKRGVVDHENTKRGALPLLTVPSFNNTALAF